MRSPAAQPTTALVLASIWLICTHIRTACTLDQPLVLSPAPISDTRAVIVIAEAKVVPRSLRLILDDFTSESVSGNSLCGLLFPIGDDGSNRH